MRPVKLAWASRLGIALPLLLLLVAFAPAAPTPAPRERHSEATIEAIAMDGSRLAYAAPDARGVERIWIWNVLTGKQTRGNSPTSYTGSYLQLRGLAVDRHRTAWMLRTCGNSECTDDLYTSSSPASPDRHVARADRTGDACSAGDDCVDGDWMMGLVGSGDLIAVSRWSGDAAGTVERAGLDLLRGRSLSRIVSGPQGIVAWAADGGRIAVLRPAGRVSSVHGPYEGSSVAIYSVAGRLLRTVGPVSAKEIALRGDVLLVLSRTATLDTYSARTGALLHRWKVRSHARGLDAYGGVAVYANSPAGYWRSPFYVHAVRLSTGRDVVVARGEGTSLLPLAAMEAPGLVYARDLHNLAFLPLARVLAAVGVDAAGSRA